MDDDDDGWIDVCGNGWSVVVDDDDGWIGVCGNGGWSLRVR